MNKKLNLDKSYGITNVIFGPACNQNANRTIVFDVKGRPMRQVAGSVVPYDRLITTPCTITLTNASAESVTITIQPETGYVNYVLNQAGSRPQ